MRACVTMMAALVAACGGEPIAIEKASAPAVWEGLGCGAGGCDGACTAAAGCAGNRRPPLVYLSTSAAVASASATIVGSDVELAVDVLATSAHGAALAVRIPVTNALPRGAYTLDLRVIGEDGSEASTELEAQGFDELVLTGPLPADHGDATYSSIVVPTAIVARLDGDQPIRLVSLADLVLAGVVSVDATAQRPGPGGCPGQARVGDAPSCAPGDGSGVVSGDAGGGSFGGAGGGGALAGAITGNPMVAPLGKVARVGEPATLADENRGHGGGASGDHAGGHGGGAVVLSSWGRIALGQFARVTARGGAPTAGAGGSGGGGSGGAIVINAAAGLDLSVAGSLDLTAAPPQLFDASGGGAGAVRGGDGRIRLDGLDDADVAGLDTATPRAWQGPQWIDAPLVVGERADLTFRVDPRVTEPILVTAGAGSDLTCTPADGACRVSVSVPLGPTWVCAVLRAGFTAPPVLPENGACILVARVE